MLPLINYLFANLLLVLPLFWLHFTYFTLLFIILLLKLLLIMILTESPLNRLLSHALHYHAIYWLKRCADRARPFYLVYLPMRVILAKNNRVILEFNVVVAAYEGVVAAIIKRVFLSGKHKGLFYRIQFFPKIAERTVVRFCHEREIIISCKHMWSAWIWRMRYSFQCVSSKAYNIFDV